MSAPGDFTPRDRPKLRTILQLLLPHPETGELVGGATIVEVATEIEVLLQLTILSLFSDLTSSNRSLWNARILQGAPHGGRQSR